MEEEVVPNIPTFPEMLPAGVVMSSPGRRLGAEILDIVLMIVLLGIGWLIWLIFTSKQGQSPGKKLLGMRVVSITSGSALSHGNTFLRDFFLKGFIGGATLGLAYLWLLWDPKRQALYDKLLTATVVDDPEGKTLSLSASS
jgi:uncharacterized RDD family membrane protein YckC